MPLTFHLQVTECPALTVAPIHLVQWDRNGQVLQSITIRPQLGHNAERVCRVPLHDASNIRHIRVGVHIVNNTLRGIAIETFLRWPMISYRPGQRAPRLRPFRSFRVVMEREVREGLFAGQTLADLLFRTPDGRHLLGLVAWVQRPSQQRPLLMAGNPRFAAFLRRATERLNRPGPTDFLP